MLRSIVTLMGLSCCLPSIAADVPDKTQSLTGTWIRQPLSLPGLVERDFVTFTQGREAITGVLRLEPLDDQYPIDAIQRNGNALSFRVDYGADGKARWIGHFTGKDELQMREVPDDSQSEATDGSEPPTILRRISAVEIAKARARGKDLITHKVALPALRDLATNGLALTPPMGWNSWNHFWSSIDDGTVRTMADALVSSGLRDAGYIYLNIDDGWQGERDQQGILHSNSKFPDMKGLADYVHSKGIKLGIYISPGPLTCGGYRGSHGHEAQDAQMFARWGIDYIKYDWCTAGDIYKTRQEMQAAYQKMGEALQKTGRPIVYNLCQYGLFDVGIWGRKVGGNLWRISGDISDTWASMSSNGFETHGDAVHAGPGGWNDPDMLEIGNGGMTVEEYRTHMTLWSILAAPLILGNDLRVMTDEVKSILTNKEVIAIDQDKLGKQGRRAQKIDSLEIWTKPLADGTTALALFNRGNTSAIIKAKWSELGLSGPQHIRDVWKHAYLGRFGEGYEVRIQPHASVFLRASSDEKSVR